MISPQKPVEQPADAPRGKALILVVDDYKPAAEMLKRLFGYNGYEVHCAYNGYQALDMAFELLPDLILLDVMMPEINGFEVLKRLREEPSTSEIPTILITAKDTASDIEQGLQLGADDYMSKPVEPRELMARSQSKIREYQLHRDLQKKTKDLEVLLRVSEELTHYIALDEVVEMILYLVMDLIGGDHVVVQLFDDEGAVYDTASARRDGKNAASHYDFCHVAERMEQEGLPLLRWEGGNDIMPEYQDGIALLLKHSTRVSGLIVTASDDCSSFAQYDSRLFAGIARQATLALRNAELFAIKSTYAEELEAKVVDRTKELKSAQRLLIQSEKLASVGRLAAGIAHEINNPLQPILLNLELMLDDIESGDPIDARDIQETFDSAQRISRIVKRLLQFMRQENASDESMEVIPIQAVIEDIFGLSEKFFQKENICVVYDIDPDAYIRGNRDQMQQVLLNLMLNSAAAIEKDGTISITARRTPAGVVITLQDDGSGIEPEMLGKIFDPFVSTKSDGTGLGLFICYGIVQNHNGTIEVDSDPGVGTRFILTFPDVPETPDLQLSATG